MVAISTSSNARHRAVSARHAVLEELIALARQQVEAQLLGLVQRLAQCLLDGSAVQPETVQARLRAGNGLRQRQYAFLPMASGALEQALRREMAALAPASAPAARPAVELSLSLVPFEEMDQQLAMAGLARPFEVRHAAALQSLNGGLARLFQRDTLRLAQLPFRPEVFLTAIWQAWQEFGQDDAAALGLAELCQPEVFLDLAPVLEALNSCLQRHLALRPEVSSVRVVPVEVSVAPLPPEAFQGSAESALAPSAHRSGDHGGRATQAVHTGHDARSAQTAHASHASHADRSELAHKLRQFFAAGPVRSAVASEGGGVAAAAAAPSSLLAYLAQWPRMPMPPAEASGGAGFAADSAADAKAGAGMSTAGAAPASTGGAQIFYLPQLKAGLPRGSLSHADEGTIDLLSAVFETVFRDHNIAQEIRDLMLLLQIPVLKAALMDQQFFFQDQHPARKLIDLLSRLGWEQRMVPDAGRLQAMQRSVERVGRDGSEEAAAFATAVDELEATLAAQEQQETERMAAPIAAALKQEKALVARRQAEAALAARLDGVEVMALVRDFLSQRWIEVLAFAYRIEDEKSGAIDHATCAMDELLWSVQPKLNVHERKRLLLKLPALLGALNKWLDLVQWQGEERVQFFAELAECHAAIVRAPLELNPERQLELAIAAGKGDALQRAAALPPDIVLAGAQAMRLSDDVASLQRGMWLEFDQPGAACQQVKLAWVSPLRSLYIFATASRQEAYSLSADELAQRFDAGSVRIVCDTDVVSGALNQALARAA
ncbi:DUF1631 family protein [Pseudoduganella sp. FT93W]|uniref:DUF1631 family protein n=1 Tax=Duganella fentianensis TaxID=2692177 RepID=A0A845HX10_9BURK|nr:DUF1631 family protein [Duganella fentianensis]MYN45543.1 DUF1631 family protein [Duganella fentianensis]